MKISHLLFCASASLLMLGCASPTYNYLPVSKQVSNPPINSYSVANVGDALVTQGVMTEHDALQVNSAIELGLFSYTVKEGIFLKVGENSDSEFYSILNSFNGGGSIEKALLADPPKALQAYKVESKICGISVFNQAVCTSSNQFSRLKKAIASNNSFQQSLIYSGKFGDKIKIGYREFFGNSARPAFNNDVEYDLSQSKTIGYKGARIEIIEATNESIKYKVISNFNTDK